MANTYAERLREHRRLALLELLADTPGYEASAMLLAMALTTRTAPASTDQVATELAWLAEQGLVDVQTPGGHTMAKITARGIDTAKGLAHVPGIARPRPEA